MVERASTQKIFLFFLNTTDFRPTLTYESTSADLRQQFLTSFYTVCDYIICPQKGKHCGVFRGEGRNARDKYLFPVGWVFLGNLS